jgi:cell division protein FtsB
MVENTGDVQELKIAVKINAIREDLQKYSKELVNQEFKRHSIYGAVAAMILGAFGFGTWTQIDNKVTIKVNDLIENKSHKKIDDYVKNIVQTNEHANELKEKLDKKETEINNKLNKDFASFRAELKTIQDSYRQSLNRNPAQTVNEQQIVDRVIDKLLAHHKDQLKGDAGKDVNNEDVVNKLISDNDFLSKIRKNLGSSSIDQSSLDKLAQTPEFIQSISDKATEILIKENSKLMNKIRELIKSEINSLPPSPITQNPSVDQESGTANDFNNQPIPP